MQTVRDQLRGGDVPAYLPGGRGPADQLSDEVPQVLVGAVDVRAPVQRRREVLAVVLVRDEREGVEHRGELPAGLRGTVPRRDELPRLCHATRIASTSGSLFRHYWVLIKLLMNLFATGVLLLHTGTLTALADRAEAAAPGSDGTAGLADPSPVLHSAAAVVLLLIATVLSIYKPRGLTGRGRRSQARAPVTPAGRA